MRNTDSLEIPEDSNTAVRDMSIATYYGVAYDSFLNADVEYWLKSKTIKSITFYPNDDTEPVMVTINDTENLYADLTVSFAILLLLVLLLGIPAFVLFVKFHR